MVKRRRGLPRIRRRLLFGVDRVLSRADRAWVVLAGGPRRRRDARHVDPETGRTGAEHLQNSRLSSEVWPRVENALQRGVESDDLAAAIHEATSTAAQAVIAALDGRAAQMHREHRAILRGGRRRMRAAYGPALDSFYEAFVVAEEIGSDLQQLSVGDDPLEDALIGLHARGCLILNEIHALLAAGFPFGAWARTRSLHETAVVAAVLSTRGRDDGLADLGERFLLHAAIDRAKDLELAERSGAVEDDLLTEARQQREHLVERFGRGFGRDYGWAMPLFPELEQKGRVTFDRLEQLAGSGLNRLNYRVGGHHVHASAWTLLLNTLTRGGRSVRLTGWTNIGLGEPAAVALAAHVATTSAVVHGGDELPDPAHLIGLQVLQRLSVRTVELFAEGQAVVEAREARVQARLQR